MPGMINHEKAFVKLFSQQTRQLGSFIDRSKEC